MKNTTFHSVPNDPAVEKAFGLYGFDKAASLEKADIVVFGGGREYDLHPMFYGEALSPTTNTSLWADRFNITALRRTGVEQSLVGIGYGASFLNCMVGNGSMWQHVNGHDNGRHAAYRCDNKGNPMYNDSIWVQSSHHQLMIPGSGGEVLLRAREASTFFRGGGVKPEVSLNMTDLYDQARDVEAVMYWGLRTVIAFQPHPEDLSEYNLHCTEFFFKTVYDNVLTHDERINTNVVASKRLASFDAKRANRLKKDEVTG